MKLKIQLLMMLLLASAAYAVPSRLGMTNGQFSWWVNTTDSLIYGAEISCKNITGADYDVCDGDGGGAGGGDATYANVQNKSTNDCYAGNYSYGWNQNGTPKCRDDANTAGAYPDAWLNQTLATHTDVNNNLTQAITWLTNNATWLFSLINNNITMTGTWITNNITKTETDIRSNIATNKTEIESTVANNATVLRTLIDSNITIARSWIDNNASLRALHSNVANNLTLAQTNINNNLTQAATWGTNNMTYNNGQFMNKTGNTSGTIGIPTNNKVCLQTDCATFVNGSGFYWNSGADYIQINTTHILIHKN